jgi:hypothetical protein
VERHPAGHEPGRAEEGADDAEDETGHDEAAAAHLTAGGIDVVECPASDHDGRDAGEQPEKERQDPEDERRERSAVREARPPLLLPSGAPGMPGE